MKILYGVQGTGNGHISRARAMAEAFAHRHVRVDFLFSGRAPEQYFDMDCFGDYLCRTGLTFVTHQGRIHNLKTLTHNKPYQFLKEYLELDLSDYDLVLNDFEPLSAWAAKRQKIPSLGISHQNAFLYAVDKASMSQIDQWMLRYFAPVDIAIGLHWCSFNQPILPPIIHSFLHPITDNNSANKASSPDKFTLVYLPFESSTAIIHLLNQIDTHQFVVYHPECKSGLTQGNVTLNPPSLQRFKTDLLHCDGIIANAGFELASEAITLGKKLLVKPLQGQFEQLSNTQTLVRLGLATCMQHLSSTCIIRWLAKEQSRPIEYPDVPTPLVDWILSGKWEKVDQLAAQLWDQVSACNPQFNHIG